MNMQVYNYNETNTAWSMTSFQRLMFIVLEFLFLLVCLYLLVAYTFYVKFRQPKQSHHNPHQGGNRVFLTFVFLLILFGLMKSSLVMLAFFIPQQMTSAHCDIIDRSYQGITVIALFVLYFFLWFRQYTLYREPSIASLVSSWLAKFSKYLIIVMLVVGAGLGAAVMLTEDESHHKFLNISNKCVFTRRTDPNTITLYACYAFLSLWQGAMLFLFVHILRKHQAELSYNNIGGHSSSFHKLHRLIKNCTAACVITISTDVITLVLYTELPRSIPQPIFLFIWDVNYMVNLGCVLFCFASWKPMMWPWRRVGQNTPRPKRIQVVV